MMGFHHIWTRSRLLFVTSRGGATSSSIRLGLFQKQTSFLPSPAMQSNDTAIRTFASKKHKNLLRHTKGFRGRAKNCFSIAIRRLQKSWQHAYRDRKNKKREWHRLWISRISAGSRQYSLSYSKFWFLYKQTGMKMDRKIISELAANEPFAFRSVIQVVEKQNLK